MDASVKKAQEALRLLREKSNALTIKFKRGEVDISSDDLSEGETIAISVGFKDGSKESFRNQKWDEETKNLIKSLEPVSRFITIFVG